MNKKPPSFAKMNTKVILILTAIFLVTFVSAKPLIKTEFNFEEAPPNLHKLIKRAAVASESSAKTGFTGITATQGTKNHKKTRECEEFEREPITKRWKCIKFLVVSQDS